MGIAPSSVFEVWEGTVHRGNGVLVHCVHFSMKRAQAPESHQCERTLLGRRPSAINGSIGREKNRDQGD